MFASVIVREPGIPAPDPITGVSFQPKPIPDGSSPGALVKVHSIEPTDAPGGRFTVRVSLLGDGPMRLPFQVMDDRRIVIDVPRHWAQRDEWIKNITTEIAAAWHPGLGPEPRSHPFIVAPVQLPAPSAQASIADHIFAARAHAELKVRLNDALHRFRNPGLRADQLAAAIAEAAAIVAKLDNKVGELERAADEAVKQTNIALHRRVASEKQELAELLGFYRARHEQLASELPTVQAREAELLAKLAGMMAGLASRAGPNDARILALYPAVCEFVAEVRLKADSSASCRPSIILP
jgi:hypothetical protein